jgi:small neutral amino acid transporter SnatA (MarC family)
MNLAGVFARSPKKRAKQSSTICSRRSDGRSATSRAPLPVRKPTSTPGDPSGGGVILLVLAVMDLVIHGKPAVAENDMIGIVPLAMPMAAGPATLTTILVLRGRYGAPMTALALVANFAILLVALLLSDQITRIIRPSAMRAISKLVMILLASIAVFFIRTGIERAMGK